MKKTIIASIHALLFTAFTFCSQAEEQGFYLTFDAGANWIPNFNATFSAPGDPATGEAEIDLETGFRTDVAFGYNFSRFFGVEFETGFAYNESEDVDAWLGQVPLLASLIFRHDNPGRFVPFAGAGLGGVVAVIDLSEGDADETDTDLVFAWQLQAGMRYELSETSSIGIVYKYLGVNAPEFDLGGADQDFDVYHNHAVLATFNLAF